MDGAGARRDATGLSGGPGRSDSSPKQDSAERAAQHKYRAKIHNLLEELQRLVRPKEDPAASGKRLRNGQMSKTSILTHAAKIVRKILLDDEVRSAF
jgi:hypothetical protein